MVINKVLCSRIVCFQHKFGKKPQAFSPLNYQQTTKAFKKGLQCKKNITQISICCVSVLESAVYFWLPQLAPPSVRTAHTSEIPVSPASTLLQAHCHTLSASAQMVNSYNHN
jgi:hypothetical protein